MTFCLVLLMLSGNVSAAVRFTEQLNAELKKRIEQEMLRGEFTCQGELVCGVSLIPGFYLDRNFHPLWIHVAGITDDAAVLMSSLENAADDGLRSQDYHLPRIQALVQRLKVPEAHESAGRISQWADLEILLSDAFFLFGSHLMGGRVNPETLHPDWVIAANSEKLLKELKTVSAPIQINTVFDRLRPPHPGYRELTALLRDYRTIANAGGWPALPEGPSLHKNDKDARIPLLRNRLSISGDLLSAGSPLDIDLYDASLEAAVRKFQARHGLRVDGVVGKNTLAALNVPVADRVRQMVLNLERWRWLPHDPGDRYLLVNTADFELSVIERGQKIMALRVVVGKPARKTPVFSSTLSYFEINPYWTVPMTIAVNDILPKVKRNPGYLRENGFRVFEGWAPGARELSPESIEWRPLHKNYFPYQLRQDPGELNALGRLKFMFPNKFDVYLHDTPNRTLFNESVRGFSSGCIRTEKPIDLAAYLVSGSTRWTREAIARAIESGKRTVVYLERPIRIHLVYMTAWVDEAGVPHFRNDVYDRDTELQKALDHRKPRPVANP